MEEQKTPPVHDHVVNAVFDAVSKMTGAHKHKEGTRPSAGKTYAKVAPCRNGECEGDILKETEVSYPNPQHVIGGPPIHPHYAYRAFCNRCAIMYDVEILERSIAKSAPLP